MDRQSFEDVACRLWDRLGLAEPVFGSEPELVLLIDGFAVVLRHGEDGRVLVIEAQAGTLANRPGFEQAELEKLLKTNFMLSAMRNTIAVLALNSRPEEPRVLIRGYYRYQQNQLEELVDLVSDVMSSSETLEQLIAVTGHGAQPISGGDRFPTLGEEFVFLKP